MGDYHAEGYGELQRYSPHTHTRTHTHTHTHSSEAAPAPELLKATHVTSLIHAVNAPFSPNNSSPRPSASSSDRTRSAADKSWREVEWRFAFPQKDAGARKLIKINDRCSGNN